MGGVNFSSEDDVVEVEEIDVSPKGKAGKAGKSPVKQLASRSSKFAKVKGFGTKDTSNRSMRASLVDRKLDAERK